MKIVDVCAFYSPAGGGVKTYVDRKLAVGPAMGHEIVLIVPSDRDGVEHVDQGARIIHVASPQLIVDRRYRYFEAAAPVHALLDAEAPDFVEASSPWRTASIVADWQGSAPRSLIMHADPMSTYAYRWLGPLASRDTIDRQFEFFLRHLRRVGEQFDMTIAANNGLAARLSAGGVPRVETLPFGIESGQFSPSKRDAGLRRSLLARCGLSEDATLLLGVGRHSTEKRWPMVIDACVAASRDTPIGLVLVGEGRQTAQLARSVRGNPHIHLLESVRDRDMLARLFASADALIHGCETETFGLVAAEAAASGLPLIVPDTGGAASIVQMGSGFTYMASDALSAANAIRAFVREGSEKARLRARSRARGIPTIESHFEALFDLYQQTRKRCECAA